MKFENVTTVVSAVIRINDMVLVQDHVKLGKWSLPGGKVDPGEEPLDALRREVKEELGVNNCRARLIGVFTHQDINVVEYRYSVDVYEAITNMEPEKHTAVIYLSFKELEEVTKGAVLTHYLGTLEEAGVTGVTHVTQTYETGSKTATLPSPHDNWVRKFLNSFSDSGTEDSTLVLALGECGHCVTVSVSNQTLYATLPNGVDYSGGSEGLVAELIDFNRRTRNTNKVNSPFTLTVVTDDSLVFSNRPYTDIQSALEDVTSVFCNGVSFGGMVTLNNGDMNFCIANDEGIDKTAVFLELFRISLIAILRV